VFRPYNGEILNKPRFLERDEYIESIHKAQFKNVPTNYKRLTKEEIAQINKHPHSSRFMPVQEKGIRSSCALAYELYADGRLGADKQSFEIKFHCGNTAFGPSSAGSPFQVYAPGIFRGEQVRVWDYAVAAGDEVADNWLISDFENKNYQLRIYGPNGFFREFKGNHNDPQVEITCRYQQDKTALKKFTGDIILQLTNISKNALVIEITDNAYKQGKRIHQLGPARSKNAMALIVPDLGKNYNWYDLSVRIKGNKSFERRFAGRVETGVAGKTDPVMGKII
jgi:phospholipase C